MNSWYFPTHKTIRKGLNDSGVEAFRGQIISSLAREIIQNSLDAKKDDMNNVIVDFKYFNLPTINFPDLKSFSDNIDESIDESEQLNDKSTLKFFKKAKKLLENETIPFLRISDFNTCGLTGSKMSKNSNWNNLVKSSGISDKHSQSGGSFGIGKNAPFACSDLRTVFYSTLDNEGIEASQGVANLISVTKEDKLFTQGIGYYSSNDDFDPVFNQINFDAEFSRVSSGTDIYIAAINFTKEEFENNLIASILDSYLYAIWEETLIVNVNDKVIDKSALNNLILQYFNYVKQETNELFTLLTSPKTLTFNDFGEGEAILLLQEKVNGSRKITAIRKPWMKIQIFDGFTRSVDFIGAFIIKGKNLNEKLRRMENPQHDKWEVDRLEDIHKIHGKDLLIKIRKYISNKIVSLMDFNDDDTLELFGAGDYIKLIDDKNDQNSKIKKHHDKVSKLDLKIKKILTSNSKNNIGEEQVISKEEGSDYEFESGINTTDKFKESTSENLFKFIDLGKKIEISRNNMKLKRISNQGEYKLFIDYEFKDKDYNIEISPIDEDGNVIKDFIIIETAFKDNTKVNTYHNKILNLRSIGNKISIQFKINNKMPLSLGVVLYENN